MQPQGSAAFSAPAASNVALSSIGVLSIALLSSIWASAGVSGAVALLGLLSIYLASSELLQMVRLLFHCFLRISRPQPPCSWYHGIAAHPEALLPTASLAACEVPHPAVERFNLRQLNAILFISRFSQYNYFTPASMLVDIIRLSMVPHGAGRGWLIFFCILELIVKAFGTYNGWMLHRQASSAGGGC